MPNDESRPPARRIRALHRGLLCGGVPDQPVHLSRLRGRFQSVPPFVSARRYDHDDRPALVLQLRDPQTAQLRLVHALGLLRGTGASGSGLVLSECATLLVESIPAVRGRRRDVGHAHALQRRVRDRLRGRRRTQRPGMVPAPFRDRGPARAAMERLVNRRPDGNAHA